MLWGLLASGTGPLVSGTGAAAASNVGEVTASREACALGRGLGTGADSSVAAASRLSSL